MKEKNKTAIIVAVIGGFATVGGSICGVIWGNNYGENHQEQYIESQISNVSGDNNTVTINSVSDLVDEYNKLVSENETLKAQNMSYFNDLSDTSSRLEEVETQMGNTPIFSYANVALSIDGEDISINTNNSMVTIDGRDYVSKEIMEKLVPDNQSVIIKDDTIYVGQVIADKAYLFDQWVMDRSNCEMVASVTDSYGNIYTNALSFSSANQGDVIYNLNKKYSQLKFTIAVNENSDIDRSGVITIKADDVIVYTSPSLNKKTEPFTEASIPIQNCTLLTIEYNGDYSNPCIISDAAVFN